MVNSSVFVPIVASSLLAALSNTFSRALARYTALRVTGDDWAELVPAALSVMYISAATALLLSGYGWVEWHRTKVPGVSVLMSETKVRSLASIVMPADQGIIVFVANNEVQYLPWQSISTITKLP